MNQLWRHRLRRLRFVGGGVLAALAIMLAVFMALGQLLLPLAAHYPHRVAAMLSERLQRPVSFASMDGHWQRSGPLLVLHDVRIGSAGNPHALRLPSADVKLDFGALLRPSRHWLNLRLSGLKLDLLRDATGNWHVAGFGGAHPRASSISLRDLPGNLLLSDLDVGITDQRSGRTYRLQVNPLRLSNDGDRAHFAGFVYRSGQSSPIHVVGHFTADGRAGRLYAGGTAMDVGAWAQGIEVGAYALRSAHGSFGFWLTWRDGEPMDASARLDLTAMEAMGPGGEVSLPRLQALAHYQHSAGATRIQYAGSGKSAAWIVITGAPGHAHVDARARDVDLGMVLPLLSLSPQISPATAHWLVAARPHGQVQRVHLRWRQGSGIQWVDAQLDQVGFAAVDKRPGVDHVSARLRGDAQALALELPRQTVTLDFPHTFRQPLAFTALSGTLVAWHDDAAWHIATDAVNLAGAAVTGQVRGQVSVPDAGGAPFVDLYTALQLDDITAAKRFWPIESMPASTVRWLDRALIAGKIPAADVVLHGNLGDWPFRDHKGHFEARGVISGLQFDYGDDWPHAQGIDAVANFVNNGMQVEVSAGQSRGVHIRKAVALIPDFADPHLLLSVQGMSQKDSLFEFARASAILEDQRVTLKNLKVRGADEFGFNLDLPMDDPSGFTLGGSVVLANNTVDNDDWNLHLAALHGAVFFDKQGLAAPQLSALFHGVPSTLSLAIGGATADSNQHLKAHLHGRFSIQQLLEGQDSLASLGDIASGQADFDIGYSIASTAAANTPIAAGAPASSASSGPVALPAQATGVRKKPATGSAQPSAVQTLTVDSNLQGMALDLPAPLDKAAAASLPLHLKMGLPFAGSSVQLALGNVVRARARLPSQPGQPWSAGVALGAGGLPSLPVQGIRISGHAQRLDVSGWIKRVLAMPEGGSGGGLNQVVVDADVAEVFGKRFPGLHMQLQPGLGQMVLSVASTQMLGTLTLPTEDLATRGLVARFQRLYWPDEKTPEAGSKPASAEPATAMDAHPEVTGINPAQLPPLHLWVGDLRLGTAHLGQARFESWPTAKGMHIDQLRMQSASVHISGSGEWNGGADNSHTHMSIDFSAENLGRMLDALGFQGLFNGGKTRAHLDATWPGAPSSLALANMDGTLAVDVGKGRIPEVTPGVGRLFGLMSIAELPRRLSLDFGDVFGKGFGFDSIKGHFRLADGNAHTDDLTIKGSAAEITIKGRTGLRAHDYDQQVLVVPHLGNSLPIVGAVVGGPVGAAAGLAVQGLLGKGLNKAASARYRISGPWDKPVITLLEKKNLPRPPPQPLPPLKPAAAPAPKASATATPSSAPSAQPASATSVSTPTQR